MSNRKELFTVVVVCIIGIIFWNIYYNYYEKLYTIGTVERMQTGLKSGTVAKFTFKYKGHVYEGGTGIGDYKIKRGDRYIVEFAKDKVELSKALFYYPIPDSIRIVVPLDGWKEPPPKLTQFKRKRMELFGLYDNIFNN